jgi:hypothetical protein
MSNIVHRPHGDSWDIIDDLKAIIDLIMSNRRTYSTSSEGSESNDPPSFPLPPYELAKGLVLQSGWYDRLAD